MQFNNIAFRPTLKYAMEEAVKLGEEQNRAAAVLGPETFERVRGIVEKQDLQKRAAFYGTITEAACAGEDFSQVDSIEDIGGIYARFVVRRTFGE